MKNSCLVFLSLLSFPSLSGCLDSSNAGDVVTASSDANPPTLHVFTENVGSLAIDFNLSIFGSGSLLAEETYRLEPGDQHQVTLEMRPVRHGVDIDWSAEGRGFGAAGQALLEPPKAYGSQGGGFDAAGCAPGSTIIVELVAGYREADMPLLGPLLPMSFDTKWRLESCERAPHGS